LAVTLLTLPFAQTKSPDTWPGLRCGLLNECGVFAEFERTIIQERVRAGLTRAKAAGKTLARPRVPASKEKAIRMARKKGKGIKAIARDLGVSVSVVQRVVAAG
jgi:DNA invertase Pin-like site-specific DNA recombinase